jgi:hypothetical protein
MFHVRRSLYSVSRSLYSVSRSLYNIDLRGVSSAHVPRLTNRGGENSDVRVQELAVVRIYQWP